MSVMTMNVTGERDVRVSAEVGGDIKVSQSCVPPGHRTVDVQTKLISEMFRRHMGRSLTHIRWDNGVRVTAW